MPQRYELNEKLYQACIAKEIDYEHIKQLLADGADPLGSTNPRDEDEHLLGDLFCAASDAEYVSDRLPRIVAMFLENGMDIGKRNIPPDDGNNSNPLWDLSFHRDENALKTLKLLLDHNLDIISVDELIGHTIGDMEMVDGCDTEDPWFYNCVCIGLSTLMLAASYPYVLSGSEYIYRCIELERNDAAKLPEFRDWRRWTYDIDKSTCTAIPHGLLNATVSIKDKETEQVVWTFSI